MKKLFLLLLFIPFLAHTQTFNVANADLWNGSFNNLKLFGTVNGLIKNVWADSLLKSQLKKSDSALYTSKFRHDSLLRAFGSLVVSGGTTYTQGNGINIGGSIISVDSLTFASWKRLYKVRDSLQANITANSTLISNLIANKQDALPSISGQSGKILGNDGTNLIWVVDQTGTAGSGITNLNTLTASSQGFSTGTTGTDFGIVSSGSTHTFNLPSASASNRGALTSTDWTTFNNKLSPTPALSNTSASYKTADSTKLAGIATGATNVTDNSQIANGANYKVNTDSTAATGYTTRGWHKKGLDSLAAVNAATYATQSALATTNSNVSTNTTAIGTKANQQALVDTAAAIRSSITGGGTSYTFSNSLVNTSGTVTLVNDAATPGNSKVYGTNASGTKGYQSAQVFDATGLTGGDWLKYNGSTSSWVRTPRLTLTTTGTSGAATLDTTNNILNIPQYTGGGGTTTINNNAANSIITGSGTANTLNALSSFTATAATTGYILAINAPTGTSGVNNPYFQINDADITHSNFSTTIQAGLGTNTAGLIGVSSPSAGGYGGLSFSGITGPTASALPLIFTGYQGSTSPTSGAVVFRAAKWDGSTSATTIANTEIIAGFRNWTNSDAVLIYGNGDMITTGSIQTGTPTGGTAGKWKPGIAVTTTGLTLSTTQYIQLDIGGTLYKVAIVQ